MIQKIAKKNLNALPIKLILNSLIQDIKIYLLSMHRLFLKDLIIMKLRKHFSITCIRDIVYLKYSQFMPNSMILEKDA